MNRRFLFALPLVAAVHVFAGAQAPLKWLVYRNPSLGFGLKYPDGWDVRAQGSAVAITSGTGAAFGVLRGPAGTTIEEAVRQRFKDHPADWKQAPARFAGARAIKLVGTDRKDPTRKAVHYFVEHEGGYYFVQTVALKADWARFSNTFASIISSFEFVNETPGSTEPSLP